MRTMRTKPAGRPHNEQIHELTTKITRRRWGRMVFVLDFDEQGGPYEHCSILKMIEWRWNLEPLTLRDRAAKNLAEALDFRSRRDPVELPAFAAPPPVMCPA